MQVHGVTMVASGLPVPELPWGLLLRRLRSG